MPEVEWLKVEPQEFDFLDFAEAKRLLDAADGEWRTMILVALRTGMRMGELLALRCAGRMSTWSRDASRSGRTR